MPDEKGLYKKFCVTRTDGQSVVGKKHHGCRYLCVDLNHDDTAVDVLRLVASRTDNRQFGNDLFTLANEIETQRKQKSSIDRIHREYRRDPTRWKKKGGIEDLHKARDFIKILIDLAEKDELSLESFLTGERHE